MRVRIGTVVGAHGLGGELRIRFSGDGPENLLGVARVSLGAGIEEGEREYEVEHARPGRPGEVRVRLRGVEGREAAEALTGLAVGADASELAPLGPDEHYHFQLVGCRVEGHDGTPIGVVREIWETGAHDVLVVDAEGGRQHLLPAAGALLREVDVEGRRIVIEVIPGLLG